MSDPPTRFTPALGKAWFTPLYDVAIRVLTRESTWRRQLMRWIDLQSGQKLLDIGCGTGSLAVGLALKQPTAEIHALDPDPAVLARARLKAAKAGASIRFHHGFLTQEFIAEHGPFDVITTSLVLHQVPRDEKQRMLFAIGDALTDEGRLIIADYGWQRTMLMRAAFRLTVQAIDGVTDTQPNADNILPRLLDTAGFPDTRERCVIKTPTGSISIYAADPARAKAAQ